jgi:hypothetical protein
MHLLGRACVCYDAFSLVLSSQNLYHRVMKCDIILHIFSKPVWTCCEGRFGRQQINVNRRVIARWGAGPQRIWQVHRINASKMLLDVNVCAQHFHLPSPLLTIQLPTAETPLQVGPRKRCRLPSDRAVDLARPLQRNSQHPQPRNRRTRQEFRGLRGPRPVHQIHPSQELVRRWLGRFPASCLQLQHSRESIRVRGSS